MINIIEYYYDKYFISIIIIIITMAIYINKRCTDINNLINEINDSIKNYNDII